MRARTPYDTVLLLLVPCCLCVAAEKAAPKGKADVDIEVVIVGASGRGMKPVFDKRIPTELRKKLAGLPLAYGSYKLVAIQRKAAAFGQRVSFTLPSKEKLQLTPSPNRAATHPLRVNAQLLDRKGADIQKLQWVVPFKKPFLIHRPTGASAVIMGVSGHKP
jgi:hypothetical protein